MCNPNTYTVYGTSSFIQIPNQQTVLPGDEIAYLTSLDEWPTDLGISAGTHWWAQAGIVLGSAPNNVNYAQPELYVEANGNSYTFLPIGPANWATWYKFEILVSPTNGAANFAIDGQQVSTIGMPLNFNSGGQASDMLEVHQTSSCCNTAYGTWSNLQTYSCWTIFTSCWNSWDCCPITAGVLAVSVPPYYINPVSLTQFNAYTARGAGGGGSMMTHT